MRYQVPLPADMIGGHSAFVPGLTRYAASGAVMYKHGVHGQPGTQAIPAPTTDTTPSPDTGDKAIQGTARSVDAPDQWFPQKWYERSLNGDGTMGPVTPVRIYSDNMMPVPAIDPRGHGSTAILSAVQPQGLGPRQLIQPPAVPHWAGTGG